MRETSIENCPGLGQQGATRAAVLRILFSVSLFLLIKTAKLMTSGKVIEKRSKKINGSAESVLKQSFKAYAELTAEKARRKITRTNLPYCQAIP
jgi:ABC-type Na+ transport system ATPase subunit NatA